MSSTGKFRCPSCGGLDIRKSRRGGPFDSIMLLFDRTPFRCRRCHRRFYSTRNRQEAEAAAAAGHEEPVDQRAG